nr:cytochrome c [uncultured Flavobacterium sp.]
MNAKTLFIVLLFSSIFVGCTDDNPSTLMDNPPVVGTTTYNQNVKSIIDNNCVVCHAAVPKNGAPMSLVTYDQVKQAIMSRGLLTRISLENGNSSLMPNGGPRMSQATIDIIVKWEKDGLLEK